MKPSERRPLVWALMVPLAVLAVASVLGAVALLLERRGAIRLRRVPSPILLGWQDERGAAIAIINTDTTPGSFFLGFEASETPRLSASESRLLGGYREERGIARFGSEERVWV